MIGQGNWQQVLVFTRTKHGANHLAEQLNKDGIRSAAIHGNKSQGARTRALADFKSGDIRVLVATDIAARGLDIEELPHVVNYELPNVPEDYAFGTAWLLLTTAAALTASTAATLLATILNWLRFNGRIHFVSRRFNTRDLFLQQAFDVAQQFVFIHADQRERFASGRAKRAGRLCSPYRPYRSCGGHWRSALAGLRG